MHPDRRVLVLGGGPTIAAAHAAARMGAQAILIDSGRLGGVSTSSGALPVRVLAHAARLEARQRPARRLRPARDRGRAGLALRRCSAFSNVVEVSTPARKSLGRLASSALRFAKTSAEPASCHRPPSPSLMA